ncbi:MAG: N-acetyltransferase family protein [bacterium]
MPAPPIEFLIRRARREDVPALAAMAGEFFAFLAAIDGSDPAFDTEGAARKLEEAGFGARPKFTAVIAEAGSEAVGYAIYNIGFWADTFEGVVFMSDLFVGQAWRGRGVGRQLMESAANAGRTEGCTRIMWTVWSKNEAARRFYRAIGADAMDDEVLMSVRI